MISNNGEIQLSHDYLRKIRRLLIDSQEQVSVNNTKCPHCNNVITLTEAYTKPYILATGLTVPACDEKGVMIGECNECNEKFTIDVTNPEISDFSSGAIKIDFYFNVDDNKNEQFKYLLKSTSKVGRDSNLSKHYVDYIYDEHPLYICDQCEKDLEKPSLDALQNNLNTLDQQHYNYVNWSLKNGRGKSPEYIIVKIVFECSCGNACKSFFFKKYRETFNLNINEFSLCNIIGARDINNRIISGVYSKDNSVSWIYKLIPRWTILLDKVYIITPFVGHQWLKSTDLMSIWLELINRLDPKKSKIVLKYGQFSSFKKAYQTENDISYETLSEFNLGSELLSELKQTNDFHAKIYCGISQERCEVFSGSANLVKGKSMEVMHFNTFYNFFDFNKAFLKPLGISETLEQKDKTHSLFFDQDNNFNLFLGGGEISSDQYKDIILFDTASR
jgi:hypothetical protein